MGVRKHSNLASYALGNVLKYRTRSAAILIGLVFATTLLCSTEFIREGLMVDLTASLDEGPDIVVQKLVGGRQTSIPIDWKENVSSFSGVRLVTPRTWGYTDIGNGKLLTIMGVNATEYGSILDSIGTDIVGIGRFLEESDTRKMVVGQGIVDVMAAAGNPRYVGVGARLSLITYDGELIEFEVVGVFSSDSKIYSYDMVLTDINSAAAVLGYDNSTCTDLAIWAEHGSNVNAVALQLDNGIPQSRVLTRDAIRDIMMKTYGDRAGIVALL
ncbi:MAG: hypothetical protein V3T87_01220, partial [Candidatus Thorarchaeota archaeon]